MSTTYIGTKFFTKTSVNATTSLDFILTAEKKSSDASNNSSVVTVRAYLYYHGGVANVNTTYSTFKIDGTTVKTGSYSASKNDYLLLGSIDKTVIHNADGTFPKTSITYSVYSYHWQTQSSGTAYIPANAIATISRASTISSASNVTVPNNCSVSWVPSSSSFYYKIDFSISGTKVFTSGAIHPNSTSSYTYSGYSIDSTIGAYITQSSQGSMTATLYTYSDSECKNQLGTSSSKIFTVTLSSTDDSTKPTFNLSVSTVNSNTTIQGWGLCVTGYSKVKVTATPDNTHGATISSYTISGGTYSQNVNSENLNYTGGVITSSGNNTFNIVAKDSRGILSNTVSRTVYAWPYSKPTIKSFSVTRDTTNTAKISISATWSFSSVNSKNKSKIELKRRPRNGSYSTISTTSFGTATTFTYTDTVPSENSSYDYQLVVTDSIGESAIGNTSSSTAYVLLDFKKNGTGLAVGKMSEADKFEVGMASEFTKPATFNAGNGDLLTKSVDIKGLIYQNGLAVMGRVDRNVTNLNDCKITGLYYIQNNSASNIPISTNGWLEVIEFNSNRIMQRYTPQPSIGKSTYVRRYDEGTWGNWERIISNTDILNVVRGSSVINIPITLDWGTKNRIITSVDLISGVVNIFMSVLATSTANANTTKLIAHTNITDYVPVGTISNMGIQTTLSNHNSASCVAWINNKGEINIRPSRNVVSGEEIELNLTYNYLSTAQ